MLRDGNSVVTVDHDVQVLREADWLVEIGPGSGQGGGTVLATGTVADLGATPVSRIGGFLTGRERVRPRERAVEGEMFTYGRIRLSTRALHTVHPLKLEVPRGRLTAVTGVSGSGKTTLVLESLVPALRAKAANEQLPMHVRSVDPAGVGRVHLVDASPIGVNVRSTVATHTGVLDEVRRAYAATPEAKRLGYAAGDFSYNTGRLRCPTCDGTGQINLDVQFLPDVDIVCPQCGGHRYAPEAAQLCRSGGPPLPELLALTVGQALEQTADLKKVRTRLQALAGLGLGYLTLGEATPALSGAEVNRDQRDALFVFDEPTIGLHPLDVEVLLAVLQRLLAGGATVLVIEHDLDVIANADHVIDLGPGGGATGGRIVATGTPEHIAASPDSVTGRYLAPGPVRR